MKTMVSLFSGCGGFDVGAIAAGFTPLLAIDNDTQCADTYRCNVSQEALCADIATVPKSVYPPKVDLLIGGPPCQGFSSAGPKLASDPRNRLWCSYLAAISECNPSAFIMENVLGFGSELPKFVSALHDMTGRRYVVESRKIVAQYYGVPQFRHRLFIVGVDRRVSRVVPWPTPVAREVFDYTSAFSGMISLTEALQDLGPPGAESRSLGLDHIDIPLSPEDARIAARIPNGGSLKDIPDQYLPDTYKGRERGIRGWTWYYRKPRPQLPGRTVLASIRPIYATILAPDVYIDKCDGRFVWVAVDKCKHTSKNGLYKSPVKQRRLTIRECARLQTFPDSFVFIGSPLQKHRMIGNAVPCELARRLCEAVAKTLDGTYDGALVQQLLFDG